MENRTLTCINCPMGCQVNVKYEMKNGIPDMENAEITGNTCPRGKEYAISEMTNPTRTVTGTVSVSNRENVVVPVKTASPIPKHMVMEVAGVFGTIRVEAPCRIGDVAVSDVCGTGVDMVITNNIQ